MSAARRGAPPPLRPPPLHPFGLLLRHDGTWRHEGQPIRNRKLREHFDRSVAYLPDQDKYIVRLGHFRGQIEIEEAAFFVREVDFTQGSVALSDGTRAPLEVASLRSSPIDGALLCTVKRDLRPEGVPARFTHASQAELLNAVEEVGTGVALRLRGELRALPDL